MKKLFIAPRKRFSHYLQYGIVAVLSFIATQAIAQPVFTGGRSQNAHVCDNATLDVAALLSVNDPSTSSTLTWTVIGGPGLGTLTGLSSSASSNGGVVNPSGAVNYTPLINTAADAISIVVSDGVNSDTTDIAITITPVSVVTVSTDMAPLCPGSSTTVSLEGPAGTLVNYNVHFEDYLGAGATTDSNFSVVLDGSGHATLPVTTYDLHSGEMQFPGANTITYLYTIQSATLGTCTASYPVSSNATVLVAYPEASMTYSGPIYTNMDMGSTIDFYVCPGWQDTIHLNAPAGAVAVVKFRNMATSFIRYDTVTIPSSGVYDIYTGPINDSIIYTVEALTSGGCDKFVMDKYYTIYRPFAAFPLSHKFITTASNPSGGFEQVYLDPVAVCTGTNRYIFTAVDFDNYDGMAFGTPGPITPFLTYHVNGGPSQTVNLPYYGMPFSETINTGAVTAPQLYTFTQITNFAGCTTNISDSMYLYPISYPTGSWTIDSQVCSGADALITINGTPNQEFLFFQNDVSYYFETDNTGILSITNPGPLDASNVFILSNGADLRDRNCVSTYNDTVSVTTVTLPTSLTITGNSTLSVGIDITLSGSLAGGTWTSSDASIASVSGGVVTGINAGTALISYSITNACGTAVDTQMVTVTAAVPMGMPVFTGGRHQSVTICNAGEYDLTNVLTVYDPSTSSTLTWTVIGGPGLGTLTGLSSSAASNGGVVNPSGAVNYAPLINTAADAISIVVSDGVNSDTTDIAITITPVSAVTVSTDMAPLCPGSSTTVSLEGPAGTLVNYNVHFEDYLGAGATTDSNFSVVLDASGHAILPVTTYDLHSGEMQFPGASTITYLYTIQSATLGTCTASYPVSSNATVLVAYPEASMSYSGPMYSMGLDFHVCPGWQDTIHLNAPAGATAVVKFRNMATSFTRYDTVTIPSSGIYNIYTGPITDSIMYSVEALTSNGCDKFVMDKYYTIYRPFAAFPLSHKYITTTSDPFGAFEEVYLDPVAVCTGPNRYIYTAVDFDSYDGIAFGTPDPITPFLTYQLNGGPSQTVNLPYYGMPFSETINTGAVTTPQLYTFTQITNFAGCTTNISDSMYLYPISYPTGSWTIDSQVCSGADVTITVTGTPNQEFLFFQNDVSYSFETGNTGTLSISLSGPFDASNVFVLSNGADLRDRSCVSTYNDTVTVTTVTLPTSLTITGNSTLSVGIDITLSGSLAGGTWTSSDASIASVSGGVVTGINAGTALISYSIANACGTAVDTQMVTVTAAVPMGMPVFTGGRHQSVTICNAAPYDLANMLTVYDASTTATETWSIISAPAHGTTTGITMYPVSANGGNVTIFSGQYIPASGYVGQDTLVVIVANGTGMDTTSMVFNITATVPTSISLVNPSDTIICGGPIVDVLITGQPGALIKYNNQLAYGDTVRLDGTGNATIHVSTPSENNYYSIEYSSSDGCVQYNPAPSSVSMDNINLIGLVVGSAPINNADYCPGDTAVFYIGGGGGSFATAIYAYTNNFTGITREDTVTLSANGDYRLPTGPLYDDHTLVLLSISKGSCIGNVDPYLMTYTQTVYHPTSQHTVSTLNQFGNYINIDTVNGTNVCLGTQAAFKVSLLGLIYTGPYLELTYHIDGNPSTTVAFGYGDDPILTDTINSNTTFYLTQLSENGCPVTIADTMTFNVVLPPSATISAISPVCSGDTGVVTVAGTPNQSILVYSVASDYQNFFVGSSGTLNIPTGVLTNDADFQLLYGTNSDGCSSDYSDTVTVQVNHVLAGVTITSNPALCVGGSTTLTASVAGGTWGSSDAGIATVVGDIVTGVIAGSADIAYTVTNACGAATDTQLVTVNPLPNAGTINGGTIVCAGSSITLSNATTGGVWATSNASIATVAGGVVTGLVAGTAIVSYSVTNSCGTTVDTQMVTVNPLPDAGAITGGTSVCVGSSISLGNSTAGGVWVTSNSSIASIAGGVVTGLVAGNAIISYSVTNSCGTAVDTQMVTVNPLPNAGTINGGSIVCAGSSITLGNATTGGVWATSNTSIATVAGGVVTGLVAGTAIVSYSVTNSCGTTVDTQMVTVNPLPNAGTITGATSVCAGSSITLGNATTGGVWVTSNSSIATVAGGVVTGLVAGSAIISYSVTNSCGIAVDTQMVTVNPLPNTGTINGGTIVCAGSSITLSNATTGGVWATSNAGISTVVGGVVTGIGSGSAIISYSVTNSCGTAVDTQMVTVNPLPNAGTITGGHALCATATLTLGNITTGGTWSSSNTTVATIVGGVVTGIGAGSAIISYSVTNGCGTAVDTQMVTVNPLPNAGTITGATLVCELSSITLSNAGTGGTWSSNNTAVAVVAGGAVSGVTAGSAIISYSVTNSCGTAVDTQMVTVNPLPNAGAITGSTSVCEMSSITLGNTVTGGTWSSDNAAVAVVAGGTVSGVTTGSAIISYTVANMCGTAVDTMLLTVNPLPSAGVIAGITAVCAGSSITLYDTVSGGTWSATNGIITISGSGVLSAITAGIDTIQYIVSNGCGSDTAIQVITVDTLGAVGTIYPASTATICHGTPVALAVTMASATGSTYQWYNGITAIAGATDATYAAGTPGNYSVLISNGSCSSAPAPITVVAPPVATIGVTGGHTLYTGSFAGYQWFLNGVAIPGATASVYNESAPGSYSVVVLDGNGCTDTAAIYTVVGINSVNAASISVSIYPNPATSTINIVAPVPVNIVMYSADGRVVLSKNDTKDADISNLANGAYMIMVYDQQNILLKTAQIMKVQ